MSFQILDDQKRPVTLGKLDNIVRSVWLDFEPQVGERAVPFPRSSYPEGLKGDLQYHQQTSWYESIGWIIHSLKATTWEHVEEKVIEYFGSYLPLCQRYCSVISHFKSLGYTPKYVA